MSELTRGDIEDVVERAVEKAVLRVFLNVGIEASEPFAVRRDMEFLRDWRLMCELSRKRGVIVTVTAALSCIFALITLGLHQWFK